jgi:hypothetical protein
LSLNDLKTLVYHLIYRAACHFPRVFLPPNPTGSIYQCYILPISCKLFSLSFTFFFFLKKPSKTSRKIHFVSREKSDLTTQKTSGNYVSLPISTIIIQKTSGNAVFTLPFLPHPLQNSQHFSFLPTSNHITLQLLTKHYSTMRFEKHSKNTEKNSDRIGGKSTVWR